MEKKIIIIKPKSLSLKDKEKLTKAGNIVIEHENTSEIVFKNSQSDEYVYVNCSTCGDRIYMLTERVSSLRSGGKDFYCSRGHISCYIIK